MLSLREGLGIEGIIGRVSRLVVRPVSWVRTAEDLVWKSDVCHTGRIVG